MHLDSKEQTQLRKDTKKDIELREQGQNYNLQIIDDKKQELEDLREQKMKGHFVRSCVKGLS